MREVIEHYFDQVNKGGGVNGRKLALVALDDGYETDRTVANTKALIDDKKSSRCWLSTARARRPKQ